MLRRLFVLTILATATTTLAATAPEATKLELKTFKVKSSFEGAEALAGYNEDDNKIFMYTNGTATTDVKITDDGEFTFTLNMACDDAKKEFAKVLIKVGDEVLNKSFELTQTDAKDYPFKAKLKKGTHKLVIEFLNDEFKEGEYDRNFYLHGVKFEPTK